MRLMKTSATAEIHSTHIPMSGNLGTVFFKPHSFLHKTQTLLNANAVFNKCLTEI